MKELGIKFKEKREEIGLKLDEVSKDLDITIPQLENLEEGNINAFKDIFFLKDLIKRYTVYLNLDEDEALEYFNDFVFDYTSKIPVEEIEAKVKEINRQEEIETRKKISSPYTARKVMKAKLKPLYLYLIVTVILVTITLLIMNSVLNTKKELISYDYKIVKGELQWICQIK